MAHALLSPSAAERWFECPPSVRLTENIPDVETEYAKEGSLAHAIAELKLKKINDKGLTARKFNAEMKKLKADPLYKEEMQGYTDDYVDFIKEQMYSWDSPPSMAVEQRIDVSAYVPDGFGTSDCVLIGGDTLHVIDFKYGKGVVVEAENNKQMMLYALGAWLNYNLIYDIKKVKMTIYQPRVNNVDTWECSLDFLKTFALEISAKAEQAYKGEGEFKAGSHCQFCKVKATCRTRAEANLELTKYDLKDPQLLSLDEIGEILKKAQDLSKWADDLKDYALSQSLAGNMVAGWKAVHGRGSRSFTNTDEAIKILIDKGIAEELLYERKILTLAQMEKVVGKKDFNAMVGDLIVMSTGKPTLVVESDKREAITNVIKAEDEFSAIDNNL